MSPEGAGVVFLIMGRNVSGRIGTAIASMTSPGVLRHGVARMLEKPLEPGFTAFVRTRTSEGRVSEHRDLRLLSPRRRDARWIVSRVVVAALLFVAMSLLVGAGGLLWADRTQREAGYVWSDRIPGATAGYALTSDAIHLDTTGVQWVADDVLGAVRLEVMPSLRAENLFVGVARSEDVAEYLRGVAHRQVGDLGQGGQAWLWLGPGVTTERPGGPPPEPPGNADIWLAQSSGTGGRTVAWPLRDGDWTIVVMRADGGPGVAATVRTEATASHLASIAGGLAIIGICLLSLAARRAVQPSRPPAAARSAPVPNGHAPAASGGPSGD
jgi:hypothetical protein